MKKVYLKAFLLAALTGFACTACSCSSNTSDNPALTEKVENLPEVSTGLTVLTIGTADSGGTMYPVGNALAKVISEHDSNIKVNLSASNGSFTNVEWITGGQIDMGLVSGDVAWSAYYGTDDFADKPIKSLRAIGAIYTSVSNWMAPESAG